MNSDVLVLWDFDEDTRKDSLDAIDCSLKKVGYSSLGVASDD